MEVAEIEEIVGEPLAGVVDAGVHDDNGVEWVGVNAPV